jgi:hypothetical protein
MHELGNIRSSSDSAELGNIAVKFLVDHDELLSTDESQEQSENVVLLGPARSRLFVAHVPELYLPN